MVRYWSLLLAIKMTNVLILLDRIISCVGMRRAIDLVCMRPRSVLVRKSAVESYKVHG